jgi:AraC family transcriptional regulator
MPEVLLVKNMVCRRCLLAVEDVLIKSAIPFNKIITGEIHYLSSFFSSVEGCTIENYFIEQRIEKVKELLVYKEMSLSEISFELEYSSVAHLSNQFKKITGLTPSHFKEVGSARRKMPDQV